MARNRNRSRPEPPVPNTAESTYSYMLQCVSNETFFFVAAMLFVTQVSIVMCGTMFPPSSQNKQPVLATTCLKTPKNSMPEVYGHSLRSCKTYNLEEYSPGSLNTTNLDEDEIVFSFEMPEPEDHDSLIRYLRWQQNIIGSMFFEVAHRPEDKEDVIIFDVGMDIEFTHANKGSQFAKFYEMIDVKHQVDCKLLYNDMYACTMIKLFELSPFNFDYNMVKIKLRGDSTKLKRLTDMWLTVKNKNDFVSRLWLLFKTMVWFLAFSIAVLAYKTWRQIERHDSKFHITITEMFTSILALLLVPLDVAVRPFNAGLADSMLVFRNNNFHIALIIYWIIFIGEHLVDSKKRSLYYFARSASCITTVCSFNLVTNWWIRGGELRSSSFASVAASELSVFVLVNVKLWTALAGGLYYPLVAIAIWKHCIKNKRSLRQLTDKQYDTIEFIARGMEFLTAVTVLCIVMIVLSYSNPDSEGGHSHYSIASYFFFGVRNVHACMYNFMARLGRSDDGETVDVADIP